MEAFSYHREGDEDTLVLGVALPPEQADQVGADPSRELAFAIAAADLNEASTLRWLAACSIKRSLELEERKHHKRYIIVLDRYDDDDNCGKDGHQPLTDEEGMEQVAAELQEAMEQTGEPAGFFHVIARYTPEGDPTVAYATPRSDLRQSVRTRLREP